MSIVNEIESGYVLCDGAVSKVTIQYEDSNANSYTTPVVAVVLLVRKPNLPSCVALELEFSRVTEISMYDESIQSGVYSDIKLLESNEGYYLSFDPYDNTQVPHEEDNGVIRARALEYREIKI